MSLHDLPPTEVSEGTDATVIPFPRGGTHEQLEEHEPPKLPTPEAFSGAVNRNLGKDASGAAVFLLLLEVMKIIPSSAEIIRFEETIAELEELNKKLSAILAKDQSRPFTQELLRRFEAKLQLQNLTLNDVSDESIASLKEQLSTLREKRAPQEERVQTLQEAYDKKFYVNGSKAPDFKEKSIKLFEDTDSLVAGDEFLQLAQTMRNKARNNKSSDEQYVRFEYFTRFMLEDEMNKFKTPQELPTEPAE
jgi:hypothetical protein